MNEPSLAMTSRVTFEHLSVITRAAVESRLVVTSLVWYLPAGPCIRVSC